MNNNDIATEAVKRISQECFSAAGSFHPSLAENIIQAAIDKARGIKTTEYAKGWDDHVAAVRASRANEPWVCQHCNQKNTAWATECGRCEKPRAAATQASEEKILENERMVKGRTKAGDKLRAAQASEDNVEAKYYELIYAVSRKFINESRHATALRYILEAETRTADSGREPDTHWSKLSPPKGNREV